MKQNIIIGSNLLETITSALYENPIILFREYVQNSLDAHNESKRTGKPAVEDFKVDIAIDKQKRQIVINDNGYGIDGQLFHDKMTSFANSSKTDRTQFIGFRGIGRLAALPYCDKLTFINKPEHSSVENICTWHGQKYREKLQRLPSLTFEEIVDDTIEFEDHQVNFPEKHYFTVIIDSYSMEIDELFSNTDFDQNLRKLLPVKYSDEFTSSKKIIERYKMFMNEDLNDFMCSVYVDGTELCKNYTDAQHVLDSDIVFWDIRGKSGKNGQAGEKMGILWFTFNKKLASTGNLIDYGVLVRSKNVLMGGNDTFADLCQNSKEHVGTYTELTATLRGVYGELLINSANLSDNARREWFKTDEYSIYLKYVIIDFMKHLYRYRYASSHYYRKSTQENTSKARADLKNALVELVDFKTNNNAKISDFYDEELKESVVDNTSYNDQKQQFQFADEDIPRASGTKKKYYENIMAVIHDFFVKEQSYDVFLKLRAYIKKHLREL